MKKNSLMENNIGIKLNDLSMNNTKSNNKVVKKRYQRNTSERLYHRGADQKPKEQQKQIK